MKNTQINRMATLKVAKALYSHFAKVKQKIIEISQLDES
jgi:hypothetical protein